MSKRAKTDSFTATAPLKVTKAQNNVLVNRFKAHTNLYNSMLTEAHKRATRLRADPSGKSTPSAKIVGGLSP